jgi:deoxyribonuclease-1
MQTLCARIVPALLLLPASLLADEDALERQLMTRIYADGGKTLYCQEPFQPGDRIKLDWIYSQRQIMEDFGCITTRQCENKPAFVNARDDLHNIYPVKRTSELDRRRTLFGDLPDNVKIHSEECPYKLSFQTFDPPKEARGNVARAMLYMHTEHDLPLIGTLEMYKRWNQEDPPDDEEKRRNRLIRQLGGGTNPYIDNPQKAEELDGKQGGNVIQFSR